MHGITPPVIPRADIAVERRRAIINSLALLYQTAIDSYQPYQHDDFKGKSGPVLRMTVDKGRHFYSDRNNTDEVELHNWLTKANEETTAELFGHLREFHEAMRGIRSVLDEVKAGADTATATSTTAMTLDSGRSDALNSPEFAYDNVMGVVELSPCLREAGVVEKLLW